MAISQLCWLLVFIASYRGTNAQRAECRDKIDSYSCAHWRQNGMCQDSSYRDLMIESCQKTCNLCPVIAPIEEEPRGNCLDHRKKCLRWRNQNHCEEYSRYHNFMQQNCPRSCLFCEDLKCGDKKKRCPRYFDLGYCVEGHQYHRFMKKNCEKSCKFCLPISAVENKVQPRMEDFKKQFACDFESDECDWTNSFFEDTADWKVGIDQHGPKTGYNNSAQYIYLDTKYEGYYAILWLPWELVLPDIQRDMGNMCFHFWYQMNAGKIFVSVKVNPSFNNKQSEPIVKFTTTKKTKTWKHVKVNIPVSERYQIYLKGVIGHPQAYVVLDNFFFTSGKCF